MKHIRLPLLPLVLIAITLGIVCSMFFPVWAVRIFVTFNGVFSNFLSMFIPLLIVGLIVPGIAELGKGAGKLLIVTVVIAYFSTIFAGLFSYITSRLTFPLVLGDAPSQLAAIDMSNQIKPYFTLEMPPFVNVTTALFIAFILGLGITAKDAQTLKNVANEFRNIVTLVIGKVIIPLLPIFIYGIFLRMGAEGHVGPVMDMFIKIILIIIAMHITVLVLQFCLAGLVAHRKPFRTLWTMMPAYVTALGTSSSAATIPVTLRQALKNGVSQEVADFVVPLCATIHMPCSILKITSCCYAISLAMGMPTDLHTYLGFIMMCGITMVAAPGVPGGAIMAALGLIASMLGFDANMQGIIIAIYIAIDSFGTAGNVTGDGAIAIVIDTMHKKRKHSAKSMAE